MGILVSTNETDGTLEVVSADVKEEVQELVLIDVIVTRKVEVCEEVEIGVLVRVFTDDRDDVDVPRELTVLLEVFVARELLVLVADPE